MTVDQDSQIDDADDVQVDDDEGTVKPSKEMPTPRRLKLVRRAVGVSRHWISTALAQWRPIVLTLAVVATVTLAGGLYFFQNRPDQQTDDAVAQAAIKAASAGTVALLSFSPDTVDNDVAVAKSDLTGEFLRYFNDFSRYFVAPAVRQQGVKASASVLRAAVVDLHPDSAVVLLFIHQTTTSKEKPEPILTTNSVRVTLTKVNGSWLIAKFEPE
jgi:Mce-associated membrane protein